MDGTVILHPNFVFLSESTIAIGPELVGHIYLACHGQKRAT